MIDSAFVIPVVIRYQTQIGPHHQIHSHRLLLILVPVVFSPLDLPTPPVMPNTSTSQAIQCNLSSNSGNALIPAIFRLTGPPEDCAMCPEIFKGIPLASLLGLMPSWSISRQVEGTLSFANSHEQPLLQNLLRSIIGQLEVIDTGHNAGQVIV